MAKLGVHSLRPQPQLSEFHLVLSIHIILPIILFKQLPLLFHLPFGNQVLLVDLVLECRMAGLVLHSHLLQFKQLHNSISNFSICFNLLRTLGLDLFIIFGHFLLQLVIDLSLLVSLGFDGFMGLAHLHQLLEYKRTLPLLSVIKTLKVFNFLSQIQIA